MTLHEAIRVALKENKRPMTVAEITSIINSQQNYYRHDKEPIQSAQVYARIKNYPSVFQNINGHIVLVDDPVWKNLLTSYLFLSNTLRGIYILADIQFIIAVLLYYKRFIDINSRPGRKYPIGFAKQLDSSINLLMDSGQSLNDGLKSLDNYYIAPEGVFEECSRLLAKLDRHKQFEVWAVVNQIQTDVLSDNEFGDMYEYLLSIDFLDNNKSYVNSTPYNLRQLMVQILDPQKEKSLYDPVAGIGGLLIEALLYSGNSISFAGSEINKKIAQLGNLNLLMHGIESVQIQSEDCFRQINISRSYDYIIADLPANGITSSIEHRMLYRQYGLSAPKSGKSFGSLVLLALSKLKQAGKAVLTVSDGFLVKKGKEKEIRDLLIAQDVIECIISLPYGTLRPYTDAKASLLILNRDKPKHLANNIQFITAKTVDQNAKSVILNNNEVIDAYKSKEMLSKNAQIVSVLDLHPNTNLLAEAYDAQFLLGNIMLKEGRGKLLIDLVDIKSGINPDKLDVHIGNDIPLIKVENLSKDILDINLNIPQNDTIEFNLRYSRAIISQECILVARIGDNPKPTIFRPTNGTPRILIHNNVYALIANKDFRINVEYLYYQLHSTFIQGQIEKKRLGAIMPYISITGLKEIVIPYMRQDAQEEFVQTQKANLIAEERSRVEDRIKALGYKAETKQAESDIIKTLTHQLRPTFLGLNNITNRIVRIVKRENLGEGKEYLLIEQDEDPDIVEHSAIPDNFTLTQLLDKLSKDAIHLSEILTSVDKVMNFKLLAEDLKDVDILNFLKKYKRQKEIEQNKGYKIIVTGESVIGQLDEVSFTELLDQLLINAEKHAFLNKNSSRLNKVQFIVKHDRQRGVASIEYSNNGSPYELTQKDFTTAFEKGKKSNGSGIGGNYINRIVEAHKGKLIVTENYKKGFLLMIELPTANTKEV